jgi:predicted hotdog family 3-hydroxylacyl-ACP dehydratase
LLDRAAIRALIPHKGAMCLLDGVRDWSPHHIAAYTRAHLDPANPLCRGGRLAAVCGCEFALQAAALHGALIAGGVSQPAGWLAGLQLERIGAACLDEPAFGTLSVDATLQVAGARGIIYGFAVTAQDGAVLLQGRATIVLPSIQDERC